MAPFIFIVFFEVLVMAFKHLRGQHQTSPGTKACIWVTYFQFIPNATLSIKNSFIKCIFFNPLDAYWRFKFKYAAKVPLDANTYAIFWSPMSSMSLVLFSPWHKRVCKTCSQTHNYAKTRFWTWRDPYKLCIQHDIDTMHPSGLKEKPNTLYFGCNRAHGPTSQYIYIYSS